MATRDSKGAGDGAPGIGDQATGASAAGLFVSPVQIGPDALIHYIKEQAAEQAAASARERLNFFFSAVGLVVGLLTAAGAAALYTINREAEAGVQAEVSTQVATVKETLTTAQNEFQATVNGQIAALRTELSTGFADQSDAIAMARAGLADQVETAARTLDTARTDFEAKVNGRIDGLRAELANGIAAQSDAIATARADLTVLLEARFGDLSVETRQGLRAEVSAVVLLPLLVSEATSLSSRTLDDGKVYASADRERVIAALADLAPEIRELDGTAREIAFRRLEDVLDAFFRVGDYSAALQVYDLFPDEILALRGTRWSMAQILAGYLLLDRDAPETRRDTVMAVLNAPHDRADPTDRRWMEQLRLAQALRAGEDDATLTARMVEIEAAAPGFVPFMARFLRGQRTEFSPEGMQPSPFGLANVDRLEAALLAAQVP
jgi:hypothetical protein